MSSYLVRTFRRTYLALSSIRQQQNNRQNMNKCCSHVQSTITTCESSTSATTRSSKCVLALTNTGTSSQSQSAVSHSHMSKHNGDDSEVDGDGVCAAASLPRPEQALSEETRKQIELRQQIAFDFFSETLELYPIEQLMFCFNGGKDCTVLLDLLMRYCRLHNVSSRDIPMLYIQSDDAFAEIDQFVAYCVARYDVLLIEYKESLKEALTHMSADMPRIKAVFVGSRNTDPYCENLQPMQRTDNGWPDMMRLNPLLDWSYHDVWHYIHMHNVPYCSLYDKGYTSIGYKSNTVPNPHLRAVDAVDDDAIYRPAWELEDPTLERAGRQAKK